MMRIDYFKCIWYEAGYCLAHLAEARVFECPFKRGVGFPCQDYEEENEKEK
jgi:hypothetical protein